FFFQAEDGIRGFHVTGVQTCALPISGRAARAGVHGPARGRAAPLLPPAARPAYPPGRPGIAMAARAARDACRVASHAAGGPAAEIGRASCRERGERSVVSGWWKREKA